jgi:hypothetical protein
MDVRLLFPSAYVAAADLKGRDVTLTISNLSINEPLRAEGGTTTKKHVVSFAEMDKRPKEEQKRWVLNKTNAKTISRLYGTETDAWIGKRITLFPTTCQSFGETVDCIRVKADVPAERKPQQREPGDEN